MPRTAPGSVGGMEWTDDVSAGDWIRERLVADHEDWSTMHMVVPRGFASYARIFHPASRDRPVGEAWPGLPYGRHRRDWDAFQKRNPEIVTERVTWRETARALGTTMHPLAQWDRLVAPGVIVENEDGPRDAAGWRYGPPRMGDLEPDVVAAIAGHLAAHTTTPDAGFVALWEGFGGILGFVGEHPSRAFLQFDESSPGDVTYAPLATHNEMLSRSTKDPFNRVFSQPTWQEGILSRDISEGARLQLPHRAHVLFRGGVAELTAADWVLRMPWRDVVAESHGFPPDAHAPSLVWPDDHAWVLVTEVDYDSTIVGGSPSLIAAILDDPQLEALPVSEGAEFAWTGDEVGS